VRVEEYTVHNIVSQETSPKLWFGNMNMTSNGDVTNRNDHHMPLNEPPS